MANRRVIIVGCGGYIGSHLIDRLLEDNSFEIFGFDISSHKIARHLGNPKLHFTEGLIDAGNTETVLRPALETADLVISLAAVCQPAEYVKNPLLTIQSNFIDAYRLVDLCAKTGTWLIHASTCEVYGRTIDSYLPDHSYDDPRLFEQIEDETPLVMGPVVNQRWTYATAKALLERYIYANHTELGLPFTIFRPYNWFGPRMDFIPGRDGEGVPRVLACFMKAMLEDQPMQLVDDGTARRTITYIGDAIDAIMAMLARPERAKSRIFNIGNRDNETTIADLALMMREVYAEITGLERYREHPIETVGSGEFYGPGYEDCDRRVPDLTRAERHLGWTAKVGLRETMERTMRYFHAAYADDVAVKDRSDLAGISP